MVIKHLLLVTNFAANFGRNRAGNPVIANIVVVQLARPEVPILSHLFSQDLTKYVDNV